jgi:signal transduction histidine kinase
MTLSYFDYAVMVAATAGTLVYLFLMILIVGYRRRRTFERVLFFLALAAFCVYGGTLLRMNAQIFYSEVPSATGAVILALILSGISVLPALLVHAHAAYRETVQPETPSGALKRIVMGGYVSPAVFLVFFFLAEKIAPRQNVIWDAFSEVELGLLLIPTTVWLFALAFSIYFQLRFSISAVGAGARDIANFHRALAVSMGLIGCAIITPYATAMHPSEPMLPALLAGVAPGGILAYGIVKHRFLGIGAQKNLVYGVSAGFLAVLYLALVRRISGWAEPYFPPEATSAILIFVLIGFFEPVQRFANRVLRRNVEQQLERLQRMTNELQREAREGDLRKFLDDAQNRIREEFGLESVRIALLENDAGNEQARVDERRPAWAGQPVRLPLGKAGAQIGEMIAIPIGSSISGETHAALEFLAEQLPGIIELCRAVSEKLELERELAERERLALVGQMTASISHNLKNPLGSMKTVLQVQLENPRLDESVRRDLQMVLSELDRLSGKLNALLRYARPAVRGGEASVQIEIARVAKEVTMLMEHDAKRRGVIVELHEAPNCGCVRGSEAAVNDILSNLIVNAIEAVTAGGRVDVRLGGDEREVEIIVADDGAGIPAEQQPRLFQPFYTTKASGTGLGLAIVRRRATEIGGTVNCRSPIADGRGAEFIVRLPRMKC